MPSLIAVDVHGRDGFVGTVQDVWDAGDAVLPVDTHAPRTHLEAVLDRLRPAALVDGDGNRVQLDGAVPVDEGTAVVIATSGTTGAPKGVVHDHGSMDAAGRITSDATGTTGASRWLACLPLVHIGGFSVVTRALHAGAGLTVHDGFDAQDVNAEATSGATHVSLVPSVLERIHPPDWDLILLGGSTIPDHRPSNSIATYGMTETFGGVVYDGIPLPGVEVRTDGQGHLEIRSPTLLSGYRSTGSPYLPPPLTDDGYLRTGDVGSVDPSTGMVTVEGRIDDLIITGGVKVWPQPVEEVIRAHPSVTDCAIVGVSDPQWGQLVTAVIVPGDPDDPPVLDTLRGVVKDHLPAAHAPHAVVVTDHLERTASGKIRRNDIRFRVEHTYHR